MVASVAHNHTSAGPNPAPATKSLSGRNDKQFGKRATNPCRERTTTAFCEGF